MKTKIYNMFFVISIILCIVDATLVALVLISNQELKLFSWISMIVMMIMLPLGLLIYSILFFNNDIIIDKNGVKRIRFGKIIKHFKIDDIKVIGFTSKDTFSGWCYLSTKICKFTYQNIDKMRHDANVISFHLTKKNAMELEQFINEFGLNQKSII